MLNSSDLPLLRAWPAPGAASRAIDPRRVVPIAPESTRFILEDGQGGAIECPICGAINRWRVEVMPHGQPRRGFVCRHLKEISAICLVADADGAGSLGSAAGASRSLPLGMLVARVSWTTWREAATSAARRHHLSIT